jgi:metal-responsive CopG/Arc/MetJ family transcriptional regulator
MRTTVELPDRLYRKLRAIAVQRGMRGFSPIVEEALNDYLAAESQRRELVAAIEAAEGAWTDQDAADLETAIEQAWSQWPAVQS